MKKVVIAGMIGNGLEWYDYAIYGYLTMTISQLFFAGDDPALKLIATYGIFAAGFVMRPLGAILFGIIGDKYGRKTSLAASVLLMAIPTACIGLLPTYAQIGIFAPILLTLLRLMQGLALGGELSGSITYVVEHAPHNKRGIIGSTNMISMMIGFLMGALFTTLLTQILSPEDFMSWGWRVPFIIGLVIGMIGLYMRLYLEESPAFEEAKSAGHLSEAPVKDTLKHYWKELLTAIGIYVACTAPFYTQTVFMNSYMTNVLGYTAKQSMPINMISLIVLTLCVPIAAILGDKYGRKIVFTWSAIAYLVFSYPCFWLLGQMNLGYALAGQVLFAAIVGCYISGIPAMLVEIFPIRIRYTGMALACNLSATIFGGTAPMVETWLVRVTGNKSMIAAYVIAAAIIALISLRFFREESTTEESSESQVPSMI